MHGLEHKNGVVLPLAKNLPLAPLNPLGIHAVVRPSIKSLQLDQDQIPLLHRLQPPPKLNPMMGGHLLSTRVTTPDLPKFVRSPVPMTL